jgi:caffeoyl-CoA O-methyltransferase
MTDVRTLSVTPELLAYAVEHGTWTHDDVLDDLQAETRALGRAAGMQIGPDEGQLLTFLARLVGGRTAVEVGKLTCCDVNEEWTAIARKYWERAGVADRIELRLAPALETLRTLPATEHIDLVFIDADKTGYPDYWAELVPRVRPGGVLLADNVLYAGRIVDESSDEASIRALRTFNDQVAADDRVDVMILPAFDGLTLARKR